MLVVESVQRERIGLKIWYKAKTTKILQIKENVHSVFRKIQITDYGPNMMHRCIGLAKMSTCLEYTV